MSNRPYYSPDEWDAIASQLSVDHCKKEFVRDTLERAASAYLHTQETTKHMVGSLSKRNKWRDVAVKTDALLQSVNALGEWIAPVWGSDGEIDHPDRSELVAVLDKLERHARMNIEDYVSHVREFSNKRTPDREQLYSDVLEVWTELLSGELAISRSKKGLQGPLWSFFVAVLKPVLGREMPKSETFRDILKRQKNRRRAA